MPEIPPVHFSNYLALIGLKSSEPHILAAQKLIKNWTENATDFPFHTSGSTGIPKKITLSRNVLRWSAENSIEKLGLNANMPALLCLSAEQIGGAMLLIRAAICQCDIGIMKPGFEPAEALSSNHPYKVVSLIPAQLLSFLSSNKAMEKLNRFEVLLIGGGPLDFALEQKLIEANLKTRIYHTYGMTETASHIALRKIGANEERIYKPFPGVSVDLAENDCLKIQCPATGNDWFTTSDLAEINENGTFDILGRADWAIISGGIKILPEMLEKQLGALDMFRDLSFIIAAVPDQLLGQKAVIVFESKQIPENIDLDSLKTVLPKYNVPRGMIALPKFPLNAGSKPDRSSIASMAANFLLTN